MKVVHSLTNIKSPSCPTCTSWHTLWDPEKGVTKCYECGYDDNEPRDRGSEGWDDGLLAKLIKE
jgi:hypothetical protein